MKHHLLIALCCAFLVLLGAIGVGATSFSINYTLANAGRVSLNIYDKDGHVVRELLHADPESAGSHLITWDGQDQSGVDVPNAASCFWKLLSTPNGLTADFKVNLGGNYPKSYNDPIIYGHGCFFSAAPLSNHEACSTLTVDAGGGL